MNGTNVFNILTIILNEILIVLILCLKNITKYFSLFHPKYLMKKISISNKCVDEKRCFQDIKQRKNNSAFFALLLKIFFVSLLKIKYFHTSRNLHQD